MGLKGFRDVPPWRYFQKGKVGEYENLLPLRGSIGRLKAVAGCGQRPDWKAGERGDFCGS